MAEIGEKGLPVPGRWVIVSEVPNRILAISLVEILTQKGYHALILEEIMGTNPHLPQAGLFLHQYTNGLNASESHIIVPEGEAGEVEAIINEAISKERETDKKPVLGVDFLMFILSLLFFTAPLGAALSAFHLARARKRGSWTRKESFILKMHIICLLESLGLLWFLLVMK